MDAKPPLFKRRWLAFLLLCAVIAAPWHKHESHVSPAGYLNIVNQLVLNRALIIRHVGSDYVIRTDCTEQEGLCKDKALRDQLTAFSRNSFLNQDVRNMDVWKFDNVGNLDGYLNRARDITGPVVDNLAYWPGKIRYDTPAGSPANYLDGGVQLILLKSKSGLLLAGPIMLPNSKGVVSLDPGRHVVFGGCAQLDISLLRAWGPQKVNCGARYTLEEAEGKIFKISKHRSRDSFLRDKDTDLVVVIRPGFFVSRRVGSVRIRDQVIANDTSDNMIVSLENARYHGDSCRDASRDICTTLQRPVQANAERLLRQVAHELVGAPASFRAGATFMDGETGEVVALASYPFYPSDLKDNERSYPWLQNWLSENSNFTRLPVGSTAKIPFSVAILQQWPVLADMRVDNNGGDRFDRILGVDHPISDDDAIANPQQMDFAHFIPMSSNKFARTLMMLGLADAGTDYSKGLSSGRKPGRMANGEPAWDGYTLSGGMHTNLAPSLSGGDGFAAAWRDNLWNFFCAEPTDFDRRKQTEQIGACHTRDEFPSFWFDTGDFDNYRALGPMVFNPPELHYDEFEGQKSVDRYLMTVLGGADSTWSTIHLAQTYSRIFTNCAVTARFIKAADRNPSCNLGINQANVARVKSGMKDTIAYSGGTAYSLNGTVASFDTGGDLYTFYAKTGTPNPPIERYYNGLRAAIADDNCRVTWSNNRLAIHDAEGKTCRGQGGAMGDLYRFNATPDRAKYVNVTPGSDRVVSLESSAHYTVAQNHAPSGKALVMVIEHGKAGRLCTLSTIAINYQYYNHDQPPGPALTLARLLLTDPAVGNWLRRPCKAS
ncbi:MAG TPA: hypothetical protein VG839_10210 [Asticcacaulis sp.]|nr:hypothetical protein [Asticcacaulis sp.]